MPVSLWGEDNGMFASRRAKTTGLMRKSWCLPRAVAGTKPPASQGDSTAFRQHVFHLCLDPPHFLWISQVWGGSNPKV